MDVLQWYYELIKEMYTELISSAGKGPGRIRNGGKNMKALGKGTIERTAENRKWFESNGFKMTGETLRLGNENCNTTYVVFSGKFTPYGMVRDCGDHYIKAQYDRYDRIDKATLEITRDVEDE